MYKTRPATCTIANTTGGVGTQTSAPSTISKAVVNKAPLKKSSAKKGPTKATTTGTAVGEGSASTVGVVTQTSALSTKSTLRQSENRSACSFKWKNSPFIRLRATGPHALQPNATWADLLQNPAKVWNIWSYHELCVKEYLAKWTFLLTKLFLLEREQTQLSVLYIIILNIMDSRKLMSILTRIIARGRTKTTTSSGI